MARAAHTHYHQLQVARVRELVKQRGLPVGGSKEGLIERLLSYDSQHPFPFLKLPSEIRDMIYRLIATADTQFAKFGKQLSYSSSWGQPNFQKLRHFRPEERNRLMIQQPSIFVTCKTIRADGLRWFFQLRNFHFVVNEGILTLKMLLRWVQALGTTERSNIRTFRVTFLEIFHMDWVLFIDDIVRLLHPEAVIEFVASLNCDIQKLQTIKATWDVLKPKARMPELAGVLGTSHSTDAKFSTTSTMQAFECEGSIWPFAAGLSFEDEE